MTKIISFLLLFCFFTACQKKDIRELRSGLGKQKELIAQLQSALNNVNTDIKSLQAIVTALQSKVSVVSYTTTANGYELTMSDGSKINLTHGKDGANGTNGKDGVNAPVIGLKQDADGNYYWTIEGDWLLQNEQKVKANGTNGSNGTNGVNGATPLLQVNNNNYWEISYDIGLNWVLVRDKNNNPVQATGATGAQGPAGAQGPQGPSGVTGFSITETETAIIITYGGNIYTLPKGNGSANIYKMVLETRKSLSDKLHLFIAAAPGDRSGVWIDLNNDGKQDAGEKVNSFGSYVYYPLSVSQTITIYGKVIGFDCTGNSVNFLDVSGNTALIELYCGSNQLNILDVSKNTALTHLYCYENQLKMLDISKNTALIEFYCEKNLLNSLDVSKNITLIKLQCQGNQLSTLDVSKNINLKVLDCDNNLLSTLDVSGNTTLTEFYCFNNQLSSLDVSKNTLLTSLFCNDNKITSLDLSKNTGLKVLYCFNNQLSSLDVSKNIALGLVQCHNNQIKNADMTTFINSLPINTVVLKHVFIYDEKSAAPAEGNTLPTPAAITAANGKGWQLYKYSTTGEIQLLTP